MYLYHFGVAKFIQETLLKKIPADSLAFSGSSGGAIVSLALASEQNIEVLVNRIITEA